MQIEFHPRRSYSLNICGHKAICWIVFLESQSREKRKQEGNSGCVWIMWVVLPSGFDLLCLSLVQAGTRYVPGHLPTSVLDTEGPWLGNTLSVGLCEGRGAHHQVSFPVSLGLLTTHIMRSHFSNVFVLPQMIFPPS